jgi:hypothetical protein
MLWESKVDCRNPMVVEAIRRDDMDAVLSNLHFRDNTGLTQDRFYKVPSYKITFIKKINLCFKGKIRCDNVSFKIILDPNFDMKF